MSEPNVIEKAYQDLEKRMQEVPQPGGSFVVKEELLGRGTDTPAPRPQGLSGRKFAAFFASDVKARKVDFEIDGKPAAVWVKKLNPDDYNTLLVFFTDISASVKASASGLPDMALLTSMNQFLVQHSLVAADLWQRKATDPEAAEWEEVHLPTEREERQAFIGEKFECDPQVWNGLVQECLEEQGLGQNQGN